MLVVAPHALDEVLGCAGVIARYANMGTKVRVLILFGGDRGHDAKRRDAATQVAALLGAESPVFAGFPENRSDTVPLADVIGAIEATAQDVGAETVLLPSPATLNIDHRTTFEAGVTALRPMPDLNVRRILSYEIISSTNWVPQTHWSVFRPSVFVDISDHLAAKEKALGLYGDDMRKPPHARSIAAVRDLAHHRGATVGLFAAEAFELVRETISRSS